MANLEDRERQVEARAYIVVVALVITACILGIVFNKIGVGEAAFMIFAAVFLATVKIIGGKG